MSTKADLVTWASLEALSPHEIACLCLGVEPRKTKNDQPAWPSIPEDLVGTCDQEEWDNDYRRVTRILTRAIEEGAVETTTTGRLKAHLAIAYLDKVAKHDPAVGWFAECEFAKLVRNKQDSSDDNIKILQDKIAQLEDKIARCEARATYMTPMLTLVYKVIEQYYAAYSRYPKKDTVIDFLKQQQPSLSAKKMDAIWAVACHPSQEKGGQTRIKK
jgi:hypothetical protein